MAGGEELLAGGVDGRAGGWREVGVALAFGCHCAWCALLVWITVWWSAELCLKTFGHAQGGGRKVAASPPNSFRHEALSCEWDRSEETNI